MITKFPILVFSSSFTSFTPYLLNWSWGWKFTALLQSSNCNIKRLTFSSKISALKIRLMSCLWAEKYFSMLLVGTFGNADKKISAVFIRNKPINELCVNFNQWRYLKIFSFIGKEKSMVLHLELPFQLVRSRGRRTLAAAV